MREIKLKKNVLIPVEAAFSSSEITSEVAQSILDNGGNFNDVVEWSELWINPSEISCINESENGQAVIRFGDSGNGWSLNMTVNELLMLIRED